MPEPPKAHRLCRSLRGASRDHLKSHIHWAPAQSAQSFLAKVSLPKGYHLCSPWRYLSSQTPRLFSCLSKELEAFPARAAASPAQAFHRSGQPAPPTLAQRCAPDIRCPAPRCCSPPQRPQRARSGLEQRGSTSPASFACSPRGHAVTSSSEMAHGTFSRYPATRRETLNPSLKASQHLFQD